MHSENFGLQDQIPLLYLQRQQQPQHHVTQTMPRALRRIQEARGVNCPPYGDIVTQALPNQKLNAKSAWYMAGSKQVPDDRANVIRAGVYNAIMGYSYSTNTKGSAPTITITSACFSQMSATE